MQAESSRICAWVILSCSTQQDLREGRAPPHPRCLAAIQLKFWDNGLNRRGLRGGGPSRKQILGEG